MKQDKEFGKRTHQTGQFGKMKNLITVRDEQETY